MVEHVRIKESFHDMPPIPTKAGHQGDFRSVSRTALNDFDSDSCPQAKSKCFKKDRSFLFESGRSCVFGPYITMVPFSKNGRFGDITGKPNERDLLFVAEWPGQS